MELDQPTTNERLNICEVMLRDWGYDLSLGKGDCRSWSPLLVLSNDPQAVTMAQIRAMQGINTGLGIDVDEYW